MALCGPGRCGCSFFSSTLNISVDSNGLVTLEQAEFSDLADALADIAALQADMTAAQADITAAQADITTLETAVTRLDAYADGSESATTGTTSGTTALTVITHTTPTFTHSGHLFAEGRVTYSKTVASDVFTGTLRRDGTAFLVGHSDRSGASAGHGAMVGGPLSKTAGTDCVLDLQLTRTSGTGTATVTSAILRWWLIPN